MLASILGSLLGRTASRITGAQFQIDGKAYNLSASGPAGSSMHGGFVGFDSRVWAGEADSDATGATLKLTYLSPDGEEGYPGNASVTVTYRLDDDNRFHMNWEATTDAPTIIDMSSHVYLNLNGFKNRDIMNEYLKVNASYYLEKDATGTPTGNFIPVEGSVFDLRTPKLMEELSQGAVYNPIMALDGEGGTLREVAEETGLRQVRLLGPLTTTRHFYRMHGRWETKCTWWYGMRCEGDETPVPQTEEDITETRWMQGTELWQAVAGSYGTIREVFDAWTKKE